MDIDTQNAAVVQQPDRSDLVRQTVDLGIKAAHGKPDSNEQHLNQVIGSLVQNQLLSADDSYKLKDHLRDTEALDRVLDNRIEAVLHRHGVVTENMLKTLHKRITKLEGGS